MHDYVNDTGANVNQRVRVANKAELENQFDNCLCNLVTSVIRIASPVRWEQVSRNGEMGQGE